MISEIREEYNNCAAEVQVIGNSRKNHCFPTLSTKTRFSFNFEIGPRLNKARKKIYLRDYRYRSQRRVSNWLSDIRRQMSSFDLNPNNKRHSFVNILELGSILKC